MGFQRRSERLNGVLLLDALGEDVPEGGSDISEGSLAVPLEEERTDKYVTVIISYFYLR